MLLPLLLLYLWLYFVIKQHLHGFKHLTKGKQTNGITMAFLPNRKVIYVLSLAVELANVIFFYLFIFKYYTSKGWTSSQGANIVQLP